jgi:ClpP class serine protease
MLKMFLRQDVAERIARVYLSGITPSSKQLEDFKAARAARAHAATTTDGARTAASNDPKNYCVVGGTAQITIEGVLTEEPDFWCWLLDIPNTAYAEIRDGLALAGADPLVSKVLFVVRSPGGYCDGLFETLAAIEAFTPQKTITVDASLACSAAYAIAAMGGKIRALGPASEFGSVGVARQYFIDLEHIVEIASTAAPNKRPDVSTEEGKAIVRAELDAMHELFADAIARGRQAATGKEYTIEQVNADFGRGGVLLAAAAAAAGMVDKVVKPPKRGSYAIDEGGDEPPPAAPAAVALATPPQATQPQQIAPEPPQPTASNVVPLHPSTPRASGQGKKTMNKHELKTQHPDTYAAILEEGRVSGKAEGLTEGEAKERKRVNAHLKMGASHKAMDIATKAIASGASLADEECLADYLSAGKNADAQQARQADSDAAGAIVAGAAPVTGAEGAPDNGDLMARAMNLPAPAAAARA